MPYIVEHNKIIAVNVNTNYNSKSNYPVHDLNSVFTHYDKTKGCNVPTENKLNVGGANNNGAESK